MTISIFGKSVRITLDHLVRLSVVLFFCNPLVKIVCAKVSSMIGLREYADLAAAIIVYFPLCLSVLLKPRNYIKMDVLVLYAGIFLFFLFSWIVHPDYGYWYAREDYEVWNYVFFPLNGMWAYLFVRMESDPARLQKELKLSAWLMYLYFVYQIVSTMKRGFWYGVVGSNGQAELSYSVSFGYNVLFYMLIFLYDAIYKRKILDWVMSLIGLNMVVQYGGRGAIFCVIGFLIIAMITYVYKNREIKGVLRVCLGIITALIFYIICVHVTNLILDKMASTQGLEFTSRFMNMLGSGDLFMSNGRNRIWEASIEMIMENPWGYGAMGSRPVIGQIIVAGYPHNLFLDLWIDFGIIFGSAFILLLMVVSIILLFRKNEPWGSMFLCSFCCSCALFISLTFWAYRPFWVMIAIAVNAFVHTGKINDAKEKGGCKE